MITEQKRKEIETALLQQVEIDGTYHIDDQGLVHVTGTIRQKKKPDVTRFGWAKKNKNIKKFNNSLYDQLDVQFGVVSGHCYMGGMGLRTLQGAPERVGGDFFCNDNKLKSLVGAPQWVGGDFRCYNNILTSLEGMPSHIGGRLIMNWDPEMPLLRCLTAQRIDIIKPNYVTPKILDDIRTCDKILNQYAGQGRPGMLKAAVELIRAGYPLAAKL